MRIHNIKAILKAATQVVSLLLLGAVVTFGQQTVSLTAGPTTTVTPDGSVVPMWGYSCGTAVAGSTATCAALNPHAPVATLTTPAGWSPVVITVPVATTGATSLTINLTNNLTFTAGTGTNTVPTSLVIVGQLGGGLGTTATSTPSPDHSNSQYITWPISDPTTTNPPPAQGNRVQSFSTEVAAGTTTALTWPALRPGTYLIESGTHPSIQGPMGLYGILVVTTPAGATAGIAYPPVPAVGTSAAINYTYNAEIPVLLSEIDPVQNNAVNAAVTTAGFTETAVWSGQPGGCGDPTLTNANRNTCYPPAVNYSPLYYLVNGLGFNKSTASNSLFPTLPATGVTGTVLVRLVNAGLRMHVPSIVGAQTGTTSASGFSLIAEDGNPLPGLPRVQSEVFMAAGKTYDVMINAVNVPASTSALPLFDRELSLSANSVSRDGGMMAYIGVNGSGLPAASAIGAAVARNDPNYKVVPGKQLVISDPAQGVIANDTNVYGVTLVGSVPGLVLNTNGTFTYTGGPTSFTYCANGTVTVSGCSSGVTAVATLGAATVEAASGITCTAPSFTAGTSTFISIKTPGVLAGCKDAAGYPLTVGTPAPGVPTAGVVMDANGGFTVTRTGTTAGTVTFNFTAKNSQGTASGSVLATVHFPAASGLSVQVLDGTNKSAILDYRWVIEEDRTFYVDPTKTTTTGTNPDCSTTTVITSATQCNLPLTFGTNFHTSYMPVVATGCTGTMSCEGGQTVLGTPAVCDVGNGGCRTTGTQEAIVLPSSVALDPAKRYYISVLPGDAGDPFANGGGAPVPDNSSPTGSRPFDMTRDCTFSTTGGGTCGHGMGGAPIAAVCTPVAPATTCAGTFAPVTILSQRTPFPPSKLSVFVFEDDFPLNGEQDGGGGTGTVNTNNEPGLGQFNITLFDDAGGTGDATGQMTYDMFNQNLSNSLSGTIDPITGFDACPISINALMDGNGATGDKTATGITGTIVTCPQFENGKDATGALVPSPLAGQAVIANLMPGRYGVVATPGADRIARGEEWLQTNTLDGQKAHDSFLRIGEPSYFQEYGPAGFHVSIGFANPAVINSRLHGICTGADVTLPGPYTCTNSVSGTVTTSRMSRTPDERLYSSGDNSSFAFTQCYVSVGDSDGEDFAFTKCDANGQFSLSGLPNGTWRVTVFDQWNDMLVDGLSTPVGLGAGAALCTGAGSSTNSCNLGEIATNQWQANLYTKTFIDTNGNGIQDPGEPGLTLVPTNIRFRDGSYSNFNNTDLSGNAGFNEIFPLFSWYVVESDTIRYKNSGTHVVYDAGGPADGTCSAATAPCGNSSIGGNMANTAEQISLPSILHVPGARYCAVADCLNTGGAGSTGRVDPSWVQTEGWQGFSGQNSFIEFGKQLFVPGETGGIHGEVIYASTRPFDDPGLLIHTSWTPDVPGVTINLYQEGTAPDGSQSLKLVDTTKTTSWDDWAQGFRTDGNPKMNCPGQGTNTGTDADLFFYTLFGQPEYLDVYNHIHTGSTQHVVPFNSQYKCFDGMHNWNQVQPAPYDGMYTFPSIVDRNPTTGAPQGAGSINGTAAAIIGSNCLICVANPTDGTPMLPPGKYVVEMVVPPGYELVKEEDKNILIGDNYIAPVTQEFGGLGNVFILPDQAEVSASIASGCTPNTTTGYACNPQQSTQTLGRSTLPSHEGDTGSVETFWPCVGAARVVPDFISLFPQSGEVSPFAGATRNLCDRKEVTLGEQTSALAKFWIFTSAHVAAHFTGVITDDYTSEFDPFSPQFGEKFSPPNLPISIKDFTGAEISRVYTDQWGTYDGLTYSTWEVNPPNPTGYAPTMMVTCMNDPGPIKSPTGTMITDPLFNPQYSQFCYEIPFMPGQTQYMDTPVVPTSAFAGAGYNNPDCAYPALTPAIKMVNGAGLGPWVSAAGNTLTILALGDVSVPNNAYSGPSATAAPFNAKFVTRHYGFGAQGTVTIGGQNATVNTWSDTRITVTVPSGVPNCAVQQQQQYGGPTGNGNAAKCGELVITAGGTNGKQSIDTVTVTIGGKIPTHVAPSDSIQFAIDKASPGDLIIIDPTCTTTTGLAATCSASALNATTATQVASPAAHNEEVIMWKPVRLQGVGAASSIINANTHPAGNLTAWRQRINCMFGLSLNGSPTNSTNTYDPTGTFHCGTNGTDVWNFFAPYGGNTDFNPQVDRLPLEAVVGWDAELNGNLAEQLQEPSLMGALEGAGITVLAKGVNFPSNPYDSTLLAGFPTGTRLLSNSNQDCGTGSGNGNNRNKFPSNFYCNPSSIDGVGIQNSSQGGGGIFVHGWAHNLQIANNRINNNAGTLSGGINVGQGEFPPANIQGSATNAPPYDITSNFCSRTNVPLNGQLPYCFNVNVNVHNNYITANSSTGDELFSATPAGAGAVSFCTGSDYYLFQYNWVCGNLSSGDGGGLGHLGFSFNGDIEHNSILFNQSTNPTIPANGGGIIVMGAPDADLVCNGNATVDQDCVPFGMPGGNPGSTPLSGVGPSDGTGPGLIINANLIQGNQAEAGSGGGIAFQAVNGSDVIAFPRTPANWNSVLFTNNIVVNNVAGWDGAGISLLDSLNVNIVNDTIQSNDTTASSGVLFDTNGAQLASTQGSNCVQAGATLSCPQPAGLVAIQNSAVLTANINLPTTGAVTCPTGHPNCTHLSFPKLENDVFFDNRDFHISVGALGTGTLNQQNVVTLLPTLNQGSTGQCVAGATFWDLGVRGDSSPTAHGSGFTLSPTYSVITSGYAGTGNTNVPATVVSQYCNGSRVPPEFHSMGYQVPPGIADATVPNPVFNLTPAATVDEGNNWVNISWGPLALVNPLTGNVLGNYAPVSGSSVINRVPSSASPQYTDAPGTDFFGTNRKSNNCVDAGAVEFVGGGTCSGGGGGTGSVSISPNPQTITLSAGTLSNTANVTLTNTAAAGGASVTVTAVAVTGAGATLFPPQLWAFTKGTDGCTGTTLLPGGTCTVQVRFTNARLGAAPNHTGAITFTDSATGSPQAGVLTGVAQ